MQFLHGFRAVDSEEYDVAFSLKVLKGAPSLMLAKESSSFNLQKCLVVHPLLHLLPCSSPRTPC